MLGQEDVLWKLVNDVDEAQPLILLFSQLKLQQTSDNTAAESIFIK